MSMPQRFLSRAVVLILAILLPVAATTLGEPLSGIADDDLPALEALSLYPEDLRRSILEASTEAHVLAELSSRQERSQASFSRLLEPYEQETQEQLFQLTRYPSLVAEIVEGGPKSPAELETIAARYPEDARDAALAAGGQNWKLVSRVHALLSSEQKAFGQLVGDLPDEKQSAFLALIDTPEVLALMSENTEMTVLLGDAYERDPDGVRLAFDDLQTVVAERNAEEARDFAEVVESDPELQEEVDASYREYEEEFVEPVAPAPVQQVNVQVSIVRPYSYWVGVPPWVRADYSYYDPWMYWYPRPYWRRSGYWFGPRYTVVHRAPHYGFYGWYFNRPVHHYRYPRLSNHFLHHYDRHGYGHYDRVGYRGHDRGRHYRRFGPGGHAVGRFVRNAEREMPAGFLRDGKNRPQRLAEYGRLKNEMRRDDRRSGKKRGHGKAKKNGRDDLDRFVAKRPGDFPSLTKLAADEKAERHTKPKKGKNAGRGDGKDNKFSSNGPERITKPKKQPETRAERNDRKTAEKQAKQLRRTDEKQAREQKRTSEKQAKQQRQTDKKQVREQKRTSEKQAKPQRQTDKKQVREQKRTSEKQAKQQRQTDKKQVREQKRTSEKRAKPQRQADPKQQKRASEKEASRARSQQRAAEQQAKKQQQASEQQARQRQQAAQQQAKERQRSGEQQAKQQQRAAQEQAKQQRRQSEKQAKAQKRANEKQAKEQRQAEKKQSRQNQR